MKYIGYYDTVRGRRYGHMAAVSKMDYIAKAFNDAGESIDIVSCSMTADYAIPACSEKLSDKCNVHYFKTAKKPKRKLSKIWNVVLSRIKLFMYLIKNVKKGESVMAYHSLSIMRPMYYAKQLKGFKLILEMEEFFNNVEKHSYFSKKAEERFVKSADYYIFPTVLLNNAFNKKNKPYSICSGTYDVTEKKAEKFDDGKVHAVYAGTFSKIKQGAYFATIATEHLNENYHIHILGNNNAPGFDEAKKTIDDIAKKTSAKLTYDGFLGGDEYIKFLQRCHIGLSTQNPEHAYNDTSFPSKILSYMSNGLRVVSVRIPVVEQSDVGDLIEFYDEPSGESVAEAIKRVRLDSEDPRERIRELNQKFIKEIKEKFLR